MSLVGLDVGTTGCKAIVVDLGGRIIAQSYREYPLHSPRPGWHELDPGEVWAGIVAVLTEAAAQTGGEDPIRALAVTSQGEAGVALTADGDVLGRSLVSFDTRSAPQAERWIAEFGAQRTFEITGQPPQSMYTIPKLLWMKENIPGFAERLWKFLCFEEFVIYRLTGELVTSYALASRTMAFDVTSKCWSSVILSAAGLSPDIFATPRPSCEVVGEIRPELADQLGWPRGVRVATAGHDQPCGAFGSGVIEPGAAVDGTGTVECITAAFSEPVLTETMLEHHFCCYPHVARGLYVALAFNFTGGSLLRWFRDVLGAADISEAARTGRDVYDIILDQATEGPVNLLTLPHFAVAGTPYMDEHARGGMVGLSLSTTRGDIIKSLIDGLTFEMRLNLEILDRAGVRIDTLRAIGGGAKSAKWLQLKADIFGKPVCALDVTEAPCLGAAMAAGIAIGDYADEREAVAAAVHVQRVFEPDQTRHAQYTERYRVYERLYPSLREIAHELHALDAGAGGSAQ